MRYLLIAVLFGFLAAIALTIPGEGSWALRALAAGFCFTNLAGFSALAARAARQ